MRKIRESDIQVAEEAAKKLLTHPTESGAHPRGRMIELAVKSYRKSGEDIIPPARLAILTARESLNYYNIN